MTGPALIVATAAVTEPQGAAASARWCYDPTQPYAICLSVRCGCGIWHDWVFARDLLADGLLAPTGDGDVRVEPFPGDALLVALASPSGHALLYLDARHAERALTGSCRLVPPGTEHEHIDWDASLVALLIEELS
jgi:hypothetical protein